MSKDLEYPFVLLDGEIYGIQSVYELVGGLKVNKKGVVEAVHQYGREGRLTCPDGSGAKMQLYVSEEGKFSPHFRRLHGEVHPESCIESDGMVGLFSKLLLKKWLSRNLGSSEIDERVPMMDISDSSRRFEYTFLSRDQKIGIVYAYKRENISPEKLVLMKQYEGRTNIAAIVDADNFLDTWQYQEHMSKVQDTQGSCLFLYPDIERGYQECTMQALYYIRTETGFWTSLLLADGRLDDYSITAESIYFKGEPIIALRDAVVSAYLKKQADEKAAKEKAALEAAERIRIENEEAAERRRIQQEKAAQEAERARAEAEELKRKQETERRREKWDQFLSDLEKNGVPFNEEELFDKLNHKLYICKKCGNRVPLHKAYYTCEEHPNYCFCCDCNEVKKATRNKMHRT
jgi:hypothetical protein